MTQTDGYVDLSPYLPRLALEWLAESPGLNVREIEGSVAFVDISGFTKLSERLAKRGKVGAEELTEAIGGCFTELLAVAYADGGGLIKFGGDALLLLFTGADHASRACHAAVGMRSALRRVGQISTPAGRVRLRMSVGVHTGTFAFFLVGSRHKELLITGPAASQTTLMEQTAEAGEIVVSRDTAALLPARCRGEVKGPGVLLRAAPPVSATEPERRSGVRHDIDPRGAVPVEVCEHLAGGGLEPEHRLVTVTFMRFESADSTIADHGPSALASRLDALVSTVQEAAAEHGVAFLSTDVDRDGGKIILAAGAPRATGADEEAALIVARKTIESGPELPIKIGINRGHVFAGDIGPAYRRTYTVMGDTVNLAARLMAAAPIGEILATAGVLERSKTQFSTRALPPFTVKGKAKPVQAFSVGPALAEATAGRAGASLPLIGRNIELAELTSGMEHARGGHGRVFEIAGDPGMGASRIADEVRRAASDVAAFWTTGGPYAAATPYFPFRVLLRDVLGIGRDAPGEEAARLLEARVNESAPDLLPWLPLIGIVIDVPIEATAATDALGDEFRRNHLEFVLSELFTAVLPTAALLVFEDVHFFDEASAGLLRRLAGTAAERPWLVVATRRLARDAVPEPLSPTARTIELEPLNTADLLLIAEAATEDAPLPEHEMRTIAERSAGNPLVLRELLSAARNAGTAEDLPESIEALMTARIDQLPPRDRALLRSASVLGTVFDRTLLAAVVDGEIPAPDDPVWLRLAQYVRSENGGYRFANPLIRDAAYEGLTFRARKTLHARAGEAILISGRAADEQAELLALHFFHAGRFFETWRFARAAGERARAKYANIEAARFFGQALEASRRIGGIPLEDLVAVHELLGDSWHTAGEYSKAERAYRVAMRVAPDDDVNDARLLFKQSQIALRLGRLSVAARRLSRGRTILGDSTSPGAARQRAQLAMWYSAVRQRQGRQRDAIRWCHTTIAEAEIAGDRKAIAYAHHILDLALDAMGRAGDHENLRTALEIYEEIGDLKGQAVILNNLGMVEYFAGHWDLAVDLYERSRLTHEQIGDPVGAALGIFNIGEILSDQGRVGEAEPFLRRALRISRAAGEREGVAYALSQLGRVAARAGRFDEALVLYEEAKQEFSATGNAGEVVETRARIAECLVLAGDPRGALALVVELLGKDHAKAQASALAPLLLRTRGEALMQLGDRAGARAALEESIEAARQRTSEYDTALTLRRLASLGRDEGSPDPDAAERSDAILASLGVVATTDPPPIPDGGSESSRNGV